MRGAVVAVHRRRSHRLSKTEQLSIRLLRGQGVEGDAHCGETVQHRSRKRWRPELPNLRQVHLIPDEILGDLRELGFDVWPGTMGENVTTRDLDLASLPRGTQLGLGESAIVELTGLRNPCVQLDRYAPGLMKAMLERPTVMAIVVAGGDVVAGDEILVLLPEGEHEPLKPV